MAKINKYMAIGTKEVIDPPFGLYEVMDNAEFVNNAASTGGPGMPVGSWHRNSCGIFVLAKSAGTIVKNMLCSATSDGTNEGILNVLIVATSVGTGNLGSKEITLSTAPTDPATGAKDELVGGRLIVYVGTGLGDNYIITGNSAWTSATADLTVSVTPALLTALDATSGLYITKNAYRDVVVTPTTGLCPVGFACAASTTTQWFWMQVSGLTPCILDEAITSSQTVIEAIPGTSVAGSLEAKDATKEGPIVGQFPLFHDDTSAVSPADVAHSFVFASLGYRG